MKSAGIKPSGQKATPGRTLEVRLRVSRPQSCTREVFERAAREAIRETVSLHAAFVTGLRGLAVEAVQDERGCALMRDASDMRCSDLMLAINDGLCAEQAQA